MWFTGTEYNSTDLSGFESLFQWAIFLHEKDETIWTHRIYDNAYLEFRDRTDQAINASYCKLPCTLDSGYFVIGYTVFSGYTIFWPGPK